MSKGLYNGLKNGMFDGLGCDSKIGLHNGLFEDNINSRKKDPDAIAFLTASGITDFLTISALHNLVTQLKINGLWSKMKFIYPMVGSTADTHKWNLKDPRDLDVAFRLTFHGGWTHSSNGALPNGTTGYAETYFVPLTHLTDVNSASMSYYSRTSITNNNGPIIMGSSGSNNGASIIGGVGSGIAYWGLNDFTFPTYSASGTLGLITVNRILSASGVYYRNSSATTVTVNNNAVTNRSILLGANRSASIQQYSAFQCSLASYGSGLLPSEALSYYNIIQAFQTALNRQV